MNGRNFFHDQSPFAFYRANHSRIVYEIRISAIHAPYMPTWVDRFFHHT